MSDAPARWCSGLGVRRRPALFLALAAVLLVPAGASAQSSLFDAPPVLRSLDLLRVEVWRQPDFSGEFEVTMEGAVAHPLYRQIRVAGRDLEQVEAELRDFLRQYVEQPSLVVQGFVRIAVGGEVRKPDVYPFRLALSQPSFLSSTS